MIEPTTEYAIHIQKNIKINKQFLLSQGWKLVDEYPLFDEFQHTKNTDLYCTIGMYGEFSVGEVHWMNKTPERYFHTMNSNLTTDDYFKILELLKIYV